MHLIRHSAFLLSMLLFCLPALQGQEQIQFRRHLLNADSEFSAATVIDMNRDGRLDIVSGAWWYEAPSWDRRRFREVRQIRGRFDDYSNLAMDVDDDGDLDIVSVNYRSQSLYWCRNPGISRAGTLWETIVIDEPGASETGRLIDIDSDGKMDVLPNGTEFAAWYEVSGQAPVEWVRHDLPTELAGHGNGAGDINGDGRVDLVCPRGWAEAPENPRTGRWIWHPEFELARDCGLPILCFDVDQDGDTDLVWGRGHNVGLYWTEQRQDEAGSIQFGETHPTQDVRAKLTTTKWVQHAIDTRFACLHTLMLSDMDGDGIQDLVVGKRFMGHDGKDPGENDPLSFFWYRFEDDSRTWSAHPITYGGSCGVDLDSVCADLDADGDMDILAPARCGLHWIENLRIGSNHPTAGTTVPILPTYESHQDLSYVLDDSGQRRVLSNALDHGLRRSHVLAQMQAVMGPLPDTDRRVDLDVRVLQIEETDKYWRIRLNYAAEPGDRVPAFLLLPKTNETNSPAMLCLHPTHFELGKSQICGLGGQSSRFYAHELAERGFVCLAPDYPGFGDYAEYDFSDDNYASGSMKAIWNNVRAIDLLESLPSVARDRIGAIGHSLGGHNALFTAAFDQRIRSLVTSCGFTAFEAYYEGDLKGWTSDRYMPRIAQRYRSSPADMPFDFHEVLAAVAPRPLFVNAPLHDSNFEVGGVRDCQAAILPLYETLSSPENVRFEFPDAGHDFPEETRLEVYAWLKRVLK